MFIIPFILMTYLVYYQMNDAFEAEINSTNLSATHQFRDTIDNVFQEVDRLATKISIMPESEIFFISKDYRTLLNNPESVISQIINTITLVYDYIDTIYVYSEVNQYVFATRGGGIQLDSFEDDNWVDSYTNRINNDPYVLARARNHIYPYYLSLVRPAYMFKTDTTGAVIVNIDIQKLGKMIQKSKPVTGQEFYIVDKQGSIMFHHNTDNLYLPFDKQSGINLSRVIGQERSSIETINELKYVVSSSPSAKQEWYYVSVLPLKEYAEKHGNINRFLLIFFLAGTCVVIMVSFFVAYKAYNPLKQIMSLLSESKQIGHSLLSQNENELKYILHSFEQSAFSQQLLKDELDNRMLLLNKAQTAALQAQIHPHFLFNTLETIKWMAFGLTNSRNDVSDMITTLSGLLNISMQSNHYLISIHDEIEHAKRYVKIMQVRYEDMVDVEWEIDPRLQHLQTLKLSLQPLIENAVYHGIKPMKKRGLITIRGWKVGEDVYFEIKDNGVGIPEDILEKLNDALAKPSAHELQDAHIGIKNVNLRIRLMLGEPYGVRIESERDMGTTVIVRLPQIKDFKSS